MLTLEEKVKFIQEKSKQFDITAYEYGQNTTISTPSAQSVLDGKGNPRNKTLNVMLEYIESKIVGSAIPGHKNYNPNIALQTLEEPSPESLEDRIAKRVTENILPHLQEIERKLRSLDDKL